MWIRPQRLLLCLLLALPACTEPPGFTPVDEPTPSPPDPTPPGDDDDDVTPSDSPDTATFAATLYGDLDDSQDAAGLMRTKMEGEFQFVYWDGEQTPLCRDRFSFTAEAHFGPLMAASCGACAGILSILSVDAGSDSEQDDACEGLSGALDLSFLLAPVEPDAVPDFRTLALVPLELLWEMDFPIGVDGTSAEELMSSYAALDLQATYIAMVRAGGWLQTDAGLGSVATAWDEAGWLPMFVLYKDADRPGNAAFLEGEVFMTSLWHVALGAGDEGGAAPSGPGDATTD